MPLHILLPLVVLGVAGIAGLLHALGYSRPAVIRDAAQACALWEHHYPGEEALGATVAADGRAALVDTARGPGLVWSLGADSAARWLDGAEAHPTGDGLVVRLPDFTAPAVHLRLPPSETELWLKAIEGARAA
ncbi:MAG: hypothetical protein ACP5DX_03775 [Paracoccaceae bacterium]